MPLSRPARAAPPRPCPARPARPPRAGTPAPPAAPPARSGGAARSAAIEAFPPSPSFVGHSLSVFRVHFAGAPDWPSIRPPVHDEGRPVRGGLRHRCFAPLLLLG